MYVEKKSSASQKDRSLPMSGKNVEMNKIGIISNAARRQIEALSDSVSNTLGFVKNPKNCCILDLEDYNSVLDKHDLSDYYGNTTDIKWNFQYAMMAYIQKKTRFSIRQHKAPSRIEGVSYDFGQERAGAGCNRLDNFIITSAFVRLLGAVETFELDMIKALLFYRPNGKTPPDVVEYEHIVVEEKVVLEEPDNDEKFVNFKYPPLWTWISGHTRSRFDRRKLLKKVFGFETTIPGFPDKLIEKDWYPKRNAIAHGLKNVEMSLKEYCDVEIYALKVILHYEQQCKVKMNVII